MPQIAALVVTLQLAQSLTAESAETTTWQWFQATTDARGWFITQGKATVSVADAKFSAELRDVDHESFVRVTLKGSIVGGSVSAKATVQNSDVSSTTVTGRLRRFCWTTGGREILVLTDGADVISLFRELRKGEPCKAAPK